MYVLDSSAIIELLSGTSLGKKVNDFVGDAPLAATSISISEVVSGAKGKAFEAALGFFNSVLILDFDKESAFESVEIENALRKAGRLIERTDIFIAAICRKHDLWLVSCDPDFTNVKSIKTKIITQVASV
ncbi:MAG TPA: PIN domain-containing protein [Candidatus Nanoarchaeia archaeon]|nr:PIN domain-containing protein [Candidatus Nanoarchaeia archaeon]